MEDTDRPCRVRQPMDRPPGAVAKEPAHQAGDDDRQQQLERDDAQARPYGGVIREERNQRRRPAEVCERVDDRGHDVEAEEHQRHQREVVVQSRGEEPGPVGAPHAQRGKDPEHPDAAQQDEGDGARAARRVPEEGVGHRQFDAPETTIPVPDEELTPVEDWRPLEELDVLAEVDEVDEEDDDDVWSLVEEVDDEDVPGIVAALIALNNPRPAKAATAVPAVRRLSIRGAASRARILESGCGGLSMSKRVSAATEPDLGR